MCTSAAPDPGDSKGGALPFTSVGPGSTRPAPRKGRNRNKTNNIRKRFRARRNAFSVHMDPIVCVRFPIGRDRPLLGLKITFHEHALTTQWKNPR